MSHSLRQLGLLTSAFAAFAATACNQSDGTTKSDAGGTKSTIGQGGQTSVTSNATVTGGKSVGGATSASTGGATSASTGGTTSTSSGGAAGGSSTLPQCSAQPRRDITVRLAYPDGMTAPTPSSIGYGGVITNQVDGTLQTVTQIAESCPACDSGTRLALSISLVDDQARTFALVASPVGLVTEWAAAASPLIGQRLSLMFRYARGFQYTPSTGFVLSDPVGPVIAAEQAQFVTALKPADLPGFTVTLGEPLCGQPGTCATNVFESLVFAGTTSATVGLTEDATFSIGPQSYGARNLGAGTLTATTCTDLERASPWSMWRVNGE
jgi:hypothetical protein